MTAKRVYNRILIYGFILFIFSGTSLFAQEKKFIHYTNKDGLPYSAITDFVQDKQGFMWISMRNSVCRFDGYEFIEYVPLDTLGNTVNLRVPDFVSLDDGELFLRTTDSRLFRYNESDDIFYEMSLPSAASGFTDIVKTGDGHLWVLSKGNLSLMDINADTIIPVKDAYPDIHDRLSNEVVHKIASRDNTLVLISGEGKIIIADLNKNEISELDFEMSSYGSIPMLSIDKYGMLWISDPEKGLTRISPGTDERLSFCDTCSGNRRIMHNMARSVVHDKEGKVWIGTENGLSVWSPVYDKMNHYRYDKSNPDGLNSNAIYDIYPDKDGNIWVGTYFGGINLWYSGQEFFSIRKSGFGPYDLGGKEVSCITEDPSGNIWVGLEGSGVNRIDAETGRVQRFTRREGVNSLSYNNVHALLWSKEDKLYIGTYTGGLNILDTESGNFSFINMNNTKNLPSDNIYSLFSLNDSILIGTDNGMVVLDTGTGLMLPFHDEIFRNNIVESICRSGDEIWMSRRKDIYVWYPGPDSLVRFEGMSDAKAISFVTTDSKDNIWAGDSYKGLFCYDREKDTIYNYNPGNGFPASRVFGLIEDVKGWYWVSTAKGLIRFRPATNTIITYNTESGLPFNQFNYSAFYRDRSDRIYFGGINGLVSFENTGDYEAPGIDNIVFSRFEIFNENVRPGERAQMDRPVNLSRKIKLRYRDKFFTVYFSALNFTHPGRIQYAYYLEGFNSEWIYPGSRNSATYTNLSPGNYSLHVKASMDNSTWSSREAILEIEVKPPFLLSTAAYIIYALIIIAGLVLFYFVSTKIEKTKALAIIERNERNQEKKLNQAKLEFFTNVSHELRTPLTLIIGPLTNVIRSGNVSGSVKDKLKHINDNARRLLALINQLMEFRKADLGKVELNVSEGDINLFSREIKEAFDNVAEVKNIEFLLENSTPFRPVWFDHEKLERILFNLLSNAFKYTEDEGRIVFRISTSDYNCSGKKEDCLLFEIEDNGRGIDSEAQKKIFDRFYRLDNKDSGEGSGIGLALVNNLVKLHKGRIELESIPGEGSLFRFRIPSKNESYTREEMAPEESVYTIRAGELVDLELSHETISDKIDSDTDKPMVLIVDDNAELLSFLSESVAERFRVKTASNGKLALEQINEDLPDVIITDIIMPEMDGVELTRTVKSSLRTSHIPVILLSAKTEVDDKYEGYMSGADSYIEKPFYPHLLLKHIENVLSTRTKLLESFRNNINSRPEEIAYSKSDKEFIEKLSGLITENIDNPDLDVSFLVNHMSVSRSLLHLKLKKIANCSATAYIRTLRLRKAAKLITAEGYNFSEAAYLTGFSSPAFFSRRFKEYFGETPSQYLERQKDDQARPVV